MPTMFDDFDPWDRGNASPEELAKKALLDQLSRYGTPELLGKGATSTVFKMVPPTRFVTKVIDCGQDLYRLTEALHELQVMRRLAGCPYVLQLEDATIVREEGRFLVCLVEELGTPFVEETRGKSYSISECIDMAIGIATALKACRDRGVLHLDVQPKNIFFSRDGRICLGDFGCSLFVDEEDGQDRVRGTLAFMAPEGFREHRYGESTDIYSVGVILYCLLNGGAYPFTEGLSGSRETVSMVAYRLLAGEQLPMLSQISQLSSNVLMPELRDICAFDPLKRPSTFEALLDCLGRMKDKAKSLCMNDRVNMWWFSPAVPVREPLIPPIPVTPPPLPDFPGDPFDTHIALFGSLDDSWGGSSACSGGSGASDRSDWQPEAPAPSASPVMFDADPIATSVALPAGDSFPAPAPAPASDPYAPPAAPPASPTPPSAPFDAGPISTTVNAAPTLPAMDQVRFSVVAPQSTERDEYATIDVVMYEEAFRTVVDQLKGESYVQVQEKQSGFFAAQRQSLIKVVLSSKTLEIEDPEQELTWLGGFLSFSFDVLVPEEYARKTVPFAATIYINGVMATKLTFVVRCLSEVMQQPEVLRKDVHSAFISYASEDRNQVIKLIQGMRAVRPDLEVFFDVQSLRVGDDWKRTIMREVESRDILYLCWSRAARASKYVDLEWRHALLTKGIEFIEPLPIEPPAVCPPPEELKMKHFNDILLYLQGSGFLN